MKSLNLNPKQIKQEERWLLEEKYAGEKTTAYLADVERLHKGEPLAYVIGWTPFLEQTIFLDSHPLIPRVETEYWLEKALTFILENGSQKTPTILDIFAGSGAIGVATLATIPSALVDFAEIEKRHLSTIKKNITENGLPLAQTHLIESNVWSAIPGKYDFIFANPPYIQNTSTAVEDSVKDFEPQEALFAEQNGLALIDSFIQGVSSHLTDQGIFWCEHDPEQTAHVKASIEKAGFISETWKDQYGKERVTMGKPSE